MSYDVAKYMSDGNEPTEKNNLLQCTTEDRIDIIR